MSRTSVELQTNSNSGSKQVRSVIFPSRLGWSAVVWNGSRLTRTTFGHDSPEAAARCADAIGLPLGQRPGDRELVQRLKQFACGKPREFSDVPLALDRFTTFQRNVLLACRDIRWGEAMTYGELARKVGCDGAARAVGTVMSKNPFPLIIPCHRVVGANGSLGGYSASSGLEMKKRLLANESSICVAGARM